MDQGSQVEWSLAIDGSAPDSSDDARSEAHGDDPFASGLPPIPELDATRERLGSTRGRSEGGKREQKAARDDEDAYDDIADYAYSSVLERDELAHTAAAEAVKDTVGESKLAYDQPGEGPAGLAMHNAPLGTAATFPRASALQQAYEAALNVFGVLRRQQYSMREKLRRLRTGGIPVDVGSGFEDEEFPVSIAALTPPAGTDPDAAARAEALLHELGVSRDETERLQRELESDWAAIKRERQEIEQARLALDDERQAVEAARAELGRTRGDARSDSESLAEQRKEFGKKCDEMQRAAAQLLTLRESVERERAAMIKARAQADEDAERAKQELRREREALAAEKEKMLQSFEAIRQKYEKMRAQLVQARTQITSEKDKFSFAFESLHSQVQEISKVESHSLQELHSAHDLLGRARAELSNKGEMYATRKRVSDIIGTTATVVDTEIKDKVRELQRGNDRLQERNGQLEDDIRRLKERLLSLETTTATLSPGNDRFPQQGLPLQKGYTADYTPMAAAHPPKTRSPPASMERCQCGKELLRVVTTEDVAKRGGTRTQYQTTHRAAESPILMEHSDSEGDASPEAMERVMEIMRSRLPLLIPEVPERPGPPVLESPTLDAIAKAVRDGVCKKIIVMTGAGISVSAGIPDFRSPNCGLYSQIARDYSYLNEPSDIFDLEFFSKNPAPFFKLAKSLLPVSARPTKAHKFIKMLDDRGLLLRNYTQNIDTLEFAAGLPEDKVVCAHGSFLHCHCMKCKGVFPTSVFRDKVMADEHPICPCGGVVKPDIVFFGESLPERFFRSVQADFPQCDLLIIMGTSLVVNPFAALVGSVSARTPRLLINRDPVGTVNPVDQMMEKLGMPHSGMFYNAPGNTRDVFLQGDCDTGVQVLADALGFGRELEAAAST
eukprot:m51a1_g2263 putative transcriptional sir2 family protein (899) ;mRNA; r:335279-339409